MKLDAGGESSLACPVLLAGLVSGVQQQMLERVNNFLKMQNMVWGCENEYCGEWKHFDFEESFDFQTLHIRDFLLNHGILKSSKDKLSLKIVNAYLMDKLKLKEKPCTRRKDLVSVWEKLFPKLNCEQ